MYICRIAHFQLNALEKMIKEVFLMQDCLQTGAYSIQSASFSHDIASVIH